MQTRLICEESYDTPDLESSTDEYANRFTGDVGRWFLDIQDKALSRSLGAIPPARVLDIGGGHGQNIHVCTRYNHHLTILGSHQDCAQRIQDSIDSGACLFKVGKLTELPFEDNSFDVCVSFRILAHINGWQQLIKEMARVATMFVIVDYPAYRSFNALSALLYPLKKRIEVNTRRYTIFHERDIVHAFDSQGMTPFYKSPQFFFPMAMHRKLGNIVVSQLLERMAQLTGLTAFGGSPMIHSFKK